MATKGKWECHHFCESSPEGLGETVAKFLNKHGTRPSQVFMLTHGCNEFNNNAISEWVTAMVYIEKPAKRAASK